MSVLELALLALIAPLALAFAVRFLYYFALRAGRRQTPDDAEMRRRGESLFLGQALRQAFSYAVAPVFSLLRRADIHPNTLTMGSVLVSIGAAALVARGELVLGGLVGLLGSSLDYLDGRLARLTGRATTAGGFLDSTLDRYSDIALLAGAAVLFRDSVPLLVASLLALGSGGVISYTRAKAESLGASLTVGLMQRPERIVLYCLGALLDPLTAPLFPAAWQPHHPLFALAILLLAALSTATAVHRTVAGFRGLRGE